MFWHRGAILRELQIQKEYKYQHMNIGSMMPSIRMLKIFKL